METTTCIRSVVAGCHMFRSNPNEASQVQLQRQLDVLITLTAKKTSLSFFEPSELLVTECLTCLMDIIIDVKSKTSLIHKTLLLLTNLAQCNTMRDCLHKTFHLTPCLARYLKTQTLSAPDQNGLLCLKLLQKVTYDIRISYQEGYIEELIQYLIGKIHSCDGDVMERCLGLLANLCRHSPCVQMHVKNSQNMKSFCKKLVMLLTHLSPTVAIFALSLLASLCLHDELGNRLFRAQNINQTFQMMFNILTGDNSVSRRYTVDLFTDLLKHAKIQNSLSIYDHLKSCLLQIMGLLCSSDPETVAKIQELILAFCQVPGLRTVVCKIMLEVTAHTPSPSTLSTPAEPIPAVVHWAAQGVDIHDNVSLLSLDLLRELYEELQDLQLMGTSAPHMDLLLVTLTEILMCPLDLNQSSLQIRCLRVVKSLRLLNALCSESGMQPSIAKAVDARMCEGLLHWQLEANPLALHTSPRALVPPVWSEVGGDIALYTLDLMVQLAAHGGLAFSGLLTKSLQDSRFVPFFAFGLTSNNRERVQTTLRLLAQGYTLDGFPNILLGDSIATCNSNNRSTQPSENGLHPVHRASSHPVLQEVSLQSKENMCTTVPSTKKQRTGSGDLEMCVQNLVEEMQNGLELKDMKTSEIISIYEHRLQSLQTKENHLQDLLEAKTLALSQADRLIAQYRCHKAQLDAEASKLRSVIVDCERRVEEFREQHNEAQLEHERNHTELEQLLQDNIRLEKIADEFDQLSQTHAEQQQKLENTQRMLTTLRQEHQTMTEMQDMLRRHNETLKQQHDVASQQLSELEDERKNLSKQLKEKEAKLQDVSKSSSKTEERLKKATRHREQLEITVDKFREDLSKAEQAKKDLQHQVTSLELVCQQHESSIKEKDEQLTAQKTELDKHAQIAALIHNLSSGKAPEGGQ